jgi:ABC-type lipoprotein release transport system permease subunit
MVLGAVVFVSNGLEKEANLSAAFAPDITVQCLQAGRQVSVSMDYARSIENISNVTVVPRVWGYLYEKNRVFTLMGIDAGNMPIPEEINFAILSGRFLQANDRKVAVVGVSFAEMFDVRVNDTLVLSDALMKPYNFTVIGIFTMDVQLYTADLIVVPINDARNFFQISNDYATDLCVYVRNPEETRYVAQRIIQDNPNLRVLTREVLREALISTYGARSGFVSVVWYIILIAVVLVVWNNASAFSTETRREVGILKALGFSTFDIIEIRLIEAVMLGIAAASLGITLGIIYDLYLGAPVIRDFMLGWAIVYPEFSLPIYVSLATVGILYIVAIFPLLVGSVLPAWNSAITEPDVAMRGV